MRYKNQYHKINDQGGGKNRAKSRARRRIAIGKTGTRLWRREFDEPRERQAKRGEPTLFGRIIGDPTRELYPGPRAMRLD